MVPATMLVNGTSAVGISHRPSSVLNRSPPNFGSCPVPKRAASLTRAGGLTSVRSCSSVCRSSMKLASARSMCASAPDSTTKRAPDILAAVSKSIRPSASPMSKCSLGVKSNAGLSPQVRISSFAASSAPSGTSASGRLGSSAIVVSSTISAALASISASASAFLVSDTLAIRSPASSPLALSAPTSFDSLLRSAWISWASVCNWRRFSSSPIRPADCGSRPRRAMALSNSCALSRIHLMSNMGVGVLGP